MYDNSLSICKFTLHFFRGFLLLQSSIISLSPLQILNSISPSPPLLFHLPYRLYLYYAIFLPFSLPLLTNPCGRPPLQQVSGASPFIRHVQFWIAIHNQFQEEMQLPDPPFIFVSTITTGDIPSLPSGYFHMKDHPPPTTLLYSTPCPHIFIPEHANNLDASHYGITISIATELYLDFQVDFLSPYPVSYP